MKGTIISAGDLNFHKRYMDIVNTSDIVVCADGGYDIALKLNVMPDIIIGDMDSITADLPKNIEIIKLLKEKDESDTEKAAYLLMERGFDEIHFLAAAGRRSDHFLANISLLLYLNEKGVKAAMHNNNEIIYPFTKEIKIQGKKGDIVSIIPFGASISGIVQEGLEYTPKNGYLQKFLSVGISNVLTKDECVIKAKSGRGIIVHNFNF